MVRIDRLRLDSMGCGAWPFLVGGVICLVNSVNERDLNHLRTSVVHVRHYIDSRESPLSYMYVQISSNC